MEDYKRYSRTERHEKRQKSKRKILFFSSLAIVFCIILFSLIAFGNKEKEQKASNEQPETEIKVSEDSSEDTEEIEVNEDNSEDNGQVEDIDPVDEVTIEEIDSDKEDVIQAYTGNWPPVPTNQVGPHTTNFSDGSDDRKEVKKAVSKVTGIAEDNMIEHWVGNGGDQKVEATVSDKAQENYFRVYLSWIDEEGWQVTKAERIKEYKKNND